MPQPPGTPDKAATAIAVSALLFVLLGDEAISGDRLDALLSEARSLAEVWLARQNYDSPH